MIPNNAIKLISTFSKEEFEKFGEFINTPYHNKNNKIVKLFSLLKEHYPVFDSEDLTKEDLFFNLTGERKYRESYIRNLLSDLGIMAEKFLQIEMISSNFEYERMLIEELKERDLADLTEKKLKAFEKKTDQIKSRDQDYYMNKNFIYEMKSFMMVDKTLTDSFRKEQLAGIIKLFMIILMENSFYLRVEEQRVSIKHNFDFLKNSLDYINNHINDFKDSPLLLIYFYLSMYFIYERDEKYFKEARKQFKKNYSKISKVDKKNMYSIFQVYYLDKIDKGDKSIDKEFLELMLEMVRFNVLSHKKGDSINLNLYRNILIFCVMRNEKKILKAFIREHLDHVSRESRKCIGAYSNAYLNFLEGNFEKTLELCNDINFNELLISTNDNLFFKSDIKTLTLKCLYELKSFENSISYIDAYRHFIRSSGLIREDVRKRYLDFLNAMSELIRLNLKFDEYKFVKFRERITGTPMAQNEWLISKIEQMDKGL